MKSKYELEIGFRTRILNQFRRFFKLGVIEQMLIRLADGRPSTSPFVKLIPPNYLYREGSRRLVEREGINYELDISDYVDHSIYFGIEDRSVNRLYQLLGDQNTILDVGANVGSILLNIAKLCQTAKIVGFEPDPRNFQRATNNIRLNTALNVCVVNKGLGLKSETVKLYHVNNKNAGMNRILNDSVAMTSSSVLDYDEIQIVRLDDFIREEGLTNIDLIKIDVEGYELNVLMGAEDTLKRHRPTLFIELDDDNLRAQGQSARELVNFISCLGYDMRRADDNAVINEETDFTRCHFDLFGRHNSH